MNRVAIAKELVKVAKDLLAFEFPTQDALDEYLKEHPDADKSIHWVDKTQNAPRVETKPVAPSPTINQPLSPVDPKPSSIPAPLTNEPWRGKFNYETAIRSWKSTRKRFRRDKKTDIDILEKDGIGEKQRQEIEHDLKDYTNVGYLYLNDCLRQKNCSEARKKGKEHIDKYLSLMPKVPIDQPVYRGVKMNAKIVQKWKESIKEGKQVSFSDEGFSSSSLSPKIALDFAERDVASGDLSVLFNTRTAKGTVLGRLITGSDGAEEEEVLLPSGAKMKIVGVSFMKGKKSSSTITVFDVVDDEG
jgi:hypothetical protein